MRAKLPCEALRKIRLMDGAEELKAYAERLSAAAANRFYHSTPFTPPNLLLLADEGAGVTHSLYLLTELLHELLPVSAFVGEEDMFEWCIEDDDSSFKRLLLRVNQAAGFYGQFNGVIGLDMRSMLAESDTLPELRRLMAFVRDQQQAIVFVFVAPQNMEAGLRKALEAELSASTVIETIELQMPDKETAAAYMLDQLRRRGFLVGSDAGEAAQNAAARLIADARFAGYRSLNTVVDEIAWRKTACREKSILLYARDFLGLDRRLVKDSMQERPSVQRKIGFGQNR